jgi:hypothetical protein
MSCFVMVLHVRRNILAGLGLDLSRTPSRSLRASSLSGAKEEAFAQRAMTRRQPAVSCKDECGCSFMGRLARKPPLSAIQHVFVPLPVFAGHHPATLVLAPQAAEDTVVLG